MNSWADGSPMDLEQQPPVTDYSLVVPQPWVLVVCKQLGSASRCDGSQGCHVDCLKWDKVLRPCFVNHRAPSRWQVTLLQQTKACVFCSAFICTLLFWLFFRCELNRKDIGLVQGKKANSDCVELLFASALAWTLHISLFQRGLQSGGEVTKRQT